MDKQTSGIIILSYLFKLHWVTNICTRIFLEENITNDSEVTLQNQGKHGFSKFAREEWLWIPPSGSNMQ